MDEEIEFENVTRLDKETVMLPNRATVGSAGYDFYYNDNEPTVINPNEIVYVKTGVKAKFLKEFALLLLNRSSNPKKKGLVLINGIGLIDSDYYDNDDNEGEIAFAFMNITDKPVTILKGDKLGQGIFIRIEFAEENTDSIKTERVGGFGSTDIEDVTQKEQIIEVEGNKNEF